MIDEHICDGDIALIENRTEARDGEIVWLWWTALMRP